MDNWRKYMADNKDRLSIEEVDEKVWQHVFKAAVPGKRSFFSEWKGAVLALFEKRGAGNEEYSFKRSNHKVRLAYACAFLVLVIVSCTYKVDSYSRYGDMVSFVLPRQVYWLSGEDGPNDLLNSFSRVANPSDTGSYLFLKCFQQSNPEAGNTIKKLKNTAGVSSLVVTPVVVEFRESLFSSLLYKAFEVRVGEARPPKGQVERKINDLLKAKGLDGVSIQVDEKRGDIRFGSGIAHFERPLPSVADTVILSKDNTVGTPNQMPVSTSQKKPERLEIKMPNLDSPRWKNDLELMSQFTKALEKEELVDGRKAYKLEIRDGEFYINDKKQSKEITDKFRKYFRNDNYTIINDADK